MHLLLRQPALQMSTDQTLRKEATTTADLDGKTKTLLAAMGMGGPASVIGVLLFVGWNMNQRIETNRSVNDTQTKAIERITTDFARTVTKLETVTRIDERIRSIERRLDHIEESDHDK